MQIRPMMNQNYSNQVSCKQALIRFVGPTGKSTTQALEEVSRVTSEAIHYYGHNKDSECFFKHVLQAAKVIFSNSQHFITNALPEDIFKAIAAAKEAPDYSVVTVGKTLFPLVKVMDEQNDMPLVGLIDQDYNPELSLNSESLKMYPNTLKLTECPDKIDYNDTRSNKLDKRNDFLNLIERNELSACGNYLSSRVGNRADVNNCFVNIFHEVPKFVNQLLCNLYENEGYPVADCKTKIAPNVLELHSCFGISSNDTNTAPKGYTLGDLYAMDDMT